MKLFRIFRRSYVAYGYKLIAYNCARSKPDKRKSIINMLTYVVELLFWLHVMTCIWIKFGAADCAQENWRDVPEDDRTWMFVAGSDFNGSMDERTIYEQLQDKGSNKNLWSLYVYSLYFVLTVVTTVGYGHASYQTNAELLYICFLEVVATLS